MKGSFMRLSLFSFLKKKGILGMNNRNLNYISRYNQRKLYRFVDDKLRTKKLAQEKGLSVPKLIDVIERQYDILFILQDLQKREQGFCIKPVHGSGGKGILVIKSVKEGLFYKTSGETLTINNIARHCSNILSGIFSLSGEPDKILIEALIQVDEMFTNISYEGIPDVRIIVFQGFPVMAMLRCSTRDSDGKANLHQGAIGIGLHICTGKAIQAVKNNRVIIHHPDTKETFDFLSIPQWDRLLFLASQCYDMTLLGYLGVDIVMDKEKGPLILELNARPGLSIQIANNEGLLPRLKLIESLDNINISIEDKIQFIKENF